MKRIFVDVPPEYKRRRNSAVTPEYFLQQCRKIGIREWVAADKKQRRVAFL